MENNNFDHLIPEISKYLTEKFLNKLSCYPELMGDIDTSALLNMSVGIFISSLIHVLDAIKQNTEGEEKLIKNIDLAKSSIIKAIEDLPFIMKVEFVK